MSLVVGLLLGFLIGIAVSEFRRRIKPKPAAAKPAHEHRYGHRWPPVSELRRELPAAPGGCAWEVKVDTDDKGSNHLHLTLVDIATEDDLASKSVDLTFCRRHGQTYAQCYRKYSSIMREQFDCEITGPLIDFAYAEINKRRSGSTTDYAMG